MIPSKNWFPTTLQERAAWFQNFTVQFTSLHIALGFTVADLDVVVADNDMMQFIAEATVATDNFSDAMRTFRRQVTEGEPLGPPPSIPALTMPGAPEDVPNGIFFRLDALVKRIRVSPTFNVEEGNLLGINPVTPARPIPGEIPPTLKAEAYPASQVQVKFVKGDSNGVAIETKLDNSETCTPEKKRSRKESSTKSSRTSTKNRYGSFW